MSRPTWDEMKSMSEHLEGQFPTGGTEKLERELRQAIEEYQDYSITLADLHEEQRRVGDRIEELQQALGKW